MDDDPKCPYCDVELIHSGRERGVELYHCPCCKTVFYVDDYGDIDNYEPMSDDDYELAKFCRGED